MTVCIDTCVLLQAAKAGHPLHVIFEAWLQRRFQWALSNDILIEYREVLTLRSGADRWKQLDRVFALAEAAGGLLVKVQPSYRFHVVTADRDDNKFTDCAITANADYLLTDDAHFAPLINAGYRPQPITPAEFIRAHITLNQ